MKKVLLSILLLLSIGISARAQELITFDFKTKVKPTLEEKSITPGTYYQVVVKGINLNLYKVSLTASDTILSKALQTPTLGNLELDAVTKAIAGISTLSTSLTSAISDKELTKDFKAFALIPEPARSGSPVIARRMEKAEAHLKSTKRSMEEIATQIDDLKLNVYKARLYAMKADSAIGDYNFEKALQDVEATRERIAALKTEVTREETDYKETAEKYKTDIAAEPELSKADTAIKGAYEKMQTALTEAHSAVNADKTNELLSSIIFLQNNREHQYKSLPFQFTGEQTKLRLTITPRDEKYLLQTYTTELKFPLQNNNYTVIGLSFYASTLYDEAYTSIKTPVNDSVAVYSFKEEEVSKAEAGISALIRFGTKINDAHNVGVHASLGPGLSVTSDKVRPRILLGGGLSFGKTHMAAVDFGGIAGAVNRRSSALDLNETYGEKPESVTVSRLRAGFFLSLGYIYKF